MASTTTPRDQCIRFVIKYALVSLFGVQNMIITCKLLEVPVMVLGFTFTPQILGSVERRYCEIYAAQYRETFWIGYILISILHFLFVFLLTLDEKVASAYNPFAIERAYACQNPRKRRTRGWMRYI